MRSDSGIRTYLEHFGAVQRQELLRLLYFGKDK